MRRVLATDLGIWPSITDMVKTADALYLSPEHRSRIAEYLLLYDQIIIPTGNFQIVPVLRLLLGDDVFIELVTQRIIVFARVNEWIGYGGNGAGVLFFQVTGNQINPADEKNNILHAFFKPIDEALEMLLRVSNPPSTDLRRNELQKLITDTTFQIPQGKLTCDLKEESYRDVLGSPYLRNMLSIRNTGRTLDQINNMAPTLFTICCPHNRNYAPDMIEVQSVLQVVFENLLLGIGSETECQEIVGDNSSLSVLQAKGQRLGLPAHGSKAFAQIQSISGIPDIGKAFSVGILTSQELLDLRYSPHAKSLRDWFAKGRPGEEENQTVRRFVETIGKTHWSDRLPSKLFRFAATNGAGLAGPIPGVLASLADTFVLNKWFPVKSPVLFLRQAKTIVVNNSPSIPKPKK